MEKLEVSKKYKTNNGVKDFIYEILFIYNKDIAFGKCNGKYTTIFNHSEINWQEYQEPETDVFAGIEEGDKVEIYLEVGLEFTGYVLIIEEDYISITDNRAHLAHPRIAYELFKKNKHKKGEILEITKLTPEKPNSITIDKDVLIEILNKSFRNGYSDGIITPNSPYEVLFL